MSELIAGVSDGKVNISESSQKAERSVGSNLGKEDFLMLLVTQMKYQNPLEPADNTEYVSQLAQFSELEQMQNMSNTTTNTSAFNLVGKYVYVQSTSPTGTTVEDEGVVDFVMMKNGDPFVSIGGNEYEYSDIVKVIDGMYVVEQKSPSVGKQSLTYLHHDPQDIVIKNVSMGEEEYEASSVAVGIVDKDGKTTTIPTAYLSYKNGTLTIDKKIFSILNAGTYDMAFVFNDPNKTVDYKNVTVTVKGIIDEETAAAVRQEIAELTGKQENSEERVADEDESEGSDDTSDDTESTGEA